MQPVKQQGEVSILEKINISSNYDNYEGSFATGDMVIVKDSEENIVCTSHLKEKDNIIKKDTEEILYDEHKGFLERADSNSFESYIECIQKAVLSLHADKYRNQPRMISPYVDYSQTEKTKLYAALSYYFIERAMLTQICLCHCDIKSVFKVGMVSIDDVEFIHAYHLITDEDGNHHIFDSSLPTTHYALHYSLAHHQSTFYTHQIHCMQNSINNLTTNNQSNIFLFLHVLKAYL